MLLTTSADMPPRLNILSLSRAIPHRPKPQTQWRFPPNARVAPPAPWRAFSDARIPQDDAAAPLPGISEEAAKIDEIEGKPGPDIGKGTPVEDVSDSGTA